MTGVIRRCIINALKFRIRSETQEAFLDDKINENVNKIKFYLYLLAL